MIYVHMFSTLLVLIGALNWGLIGAFNLNLIANLAISNYVYCLIGLAAIALVFHRETYLPFLGPSVMPCSILQDKAPQDARERLTIHIAPNTKVI